MPLPPTCSYMDGTGCVEMGHIQSYWVLDLACPSGSVSDLFSTSFEDS